MTLNRVCKEMKELWKHGKRSVGALLMAELSYNLTIIPQIAALAWFPFNAKYLAIFTWAKLCKSFVGLDVRGCVMCLSVFVLCESVGTFTMP